MKRLFLLSVVLLVSFFASTKAEAARIPIYYSNGEELKVIHELPEDAVDSDGMHYNVGIHYESFALFGMPVWNYGDYKYVLVNDAENKYIELSDEEFQQMKETYSLDLDEKPSLPLMTQIGLKPVVVIILGLMIYGMFVKDDEEQQVEDIAQDNKE